MCRSTLPKIPTTFTAEVLALRSCKRDGVDADDECRAYGIPGTSIKKLFGKARELAEHTITHHTRRSDVTRCISPCVARLELARAQRYSYFKSSMYSNGDGETREHGTCSHKRSLLLASARPPRGTHTPTTSHQQLPRHQHQQHSRSFPVHHFLLAVHGISYAPGWSVDTWTATTGETTQHYSLQTWDATGEVRHGICHPVATTCMRMAMVQALSKSW